MNIRPYVVEVCFAFAAGVCVGAWLMDRRYARLEQEKRSSEVFADNKEKNGHKKEGYFVRFENGKIVIDPSKRKRWFFF